MPVLRILTLCETSESLGGVECLIHELVKLTDHENSEDPLELNELHLINFAIAHIDCRILHRLYTQMSTVETLTLGPGKNVDNLALAMELLPTSGGLLDLPLPRLRSLAVFDIPKQLVRRIVLERQSLARPLEELHCRFDERYRYYDEDDNPSTEDDWQHQVAKYEHFRRLRSTRYTDVVGACWSPSPNRPSRRTPRDPKERHGRTRYASARQKERS